MDLGFETIGNATLICHDGGPLLATDPWITGSAYFGSWVHQHAIPPEQMEAIRACRFLWISHGHPDHLSLDSLELLREADVLLPDHYGGRIANDLKAAGYRVWTLHDGLWTQLSDRVRVMSIANVFQDAVLLVDLDGKALIVNANDAGDRGGSELVRATVARFETSFLTALMAYGDADMINVFDDSGRRIPPDAARKDPLQPGILEALDAYGITCYVPFATLHKYQRSDSVWTNEFITRPEHLVPRDEAEARRILPAYVRYDVPGRRYQEIRPEPVPDRSVDPKELGDDWADELTAEDVGKLRAYFARIPHLSTFLGYLRFRVGGKEHVIDVARDRFDRGITFETPRGSLMTAVEWRIFDDLMIGNFTKTTLHGDWHARGSAGLYPDFNPFVAKFGDNGGAYTPDELRAYFAEYRRRGFFQLYDRPDDHALGRAIQRYS